MVANATIALDAILSKYPGPLRLVSILVSSHIVLVSDSAEI